MRAVLPGLLLALALAGCLSGQTEPPAMNDPGPEPALPTDYPFVCDGPARAVAGVDGVCAVVLGEATGQLSEPALAVHPTDPDVMAVGAHFVGTATDTPRLVHAYLYVTTDGGATWTPSIVPLPGGPERFFSDASLAILDDGTVVYSGLSVQQGAVSSSVTDVFTVRTRDGTTFEPAVVASEPGAFNDRQWLVRHGDRLYLSWTVINDRVHVAVSDDGGTSWARVGQGVGGCANVGPVAMLGGEPHLGCRVLPDFEGIELYRVDVAGDRFEHVDTLTGLREITPNLFDLGDRWAVGTYWGGVVVGTPGNWSAPIHLPDAMTLDDGRREPYEYAMLADADGRLHFLAAAFHRYPQQEADAPHDAYLVTLDRDLDLVQERRLTPTGPERFSGTPAAVPPSLGDDWWTLAVGADGDLRMVWMYGGEAYVGRVGLGA